MGNRRGDMVMSGIKDRMGRLLAAAAFTASLSGCGPRDDGADLAATATPAAAADSSCPTGSPLPITGLCSDGNAALFLATDTGVERLAPRCVWRTQEVSLSPNEALVFRAQDCSGEGWDQTVYSYLSGYLKQRMTSMPEDQAGFALQIFPLADGETAEQAAMKTLDKAPDDQRTRCKTRPLSGPKLAGRAFELAPNYDLKTEMDTQFPDEPWDACGPNGVTGDAAQMWEGRKHQALFHMLGQDTPYWDPASFTFYRKGADGAWSKSN